MVDRSKERIRELAAQYMVRLHADDLQDDERAAIVAWLNADTRHKDEFSILAAVWDGIGQITEQDRDRNVAFASHGLPKPGLMERARMRRRTLAWSAIGAAASLVVAVSVLLFVTSAAPNAYTTGTGEAHSIVLDDGSVMHLNARTSVSWSYDTDLRRIDLSYGEVLFDVVHDPDRPFIVSASQGEIRAVGTRFNVYYRTTGDVVVTVLDGSVRVQQQQSNATDPIWERTLEMNEELAYRDAGVTSDVHTLPAAGERVSWRDGVIVLQNEVLLDVVEELSRYSERRIAILDPALNDVRLGGVVSVEDIPATLRFIEEAAPVTIRETADAYLIVPKEGTSKN